jgi:hypothetical protein
MTRIDTFMPTYHFNEVHATVVRATPAEVFNAIYTVKASEIALLGLLFGIRTLPARLLGRSGPARPMDRPMLDVAQRSNFIILAASPDTEIVLGTIGQFWRLTGATNIKVATPDEFLAFQEPGYAKSVMNFALDPQANGTVVRTETRVQTLDPATQREFGRYWRVIYPGSALLRVTWLRAIKKRAEMAPAIAS